MLCQVTEHDIDKVHAEYRGSGEEASDLLQLYQRFRGDMDQVLAAIAKKSQASPLRLLHSGLGEKKAATCCSYTSASAAIWTRHVIIVVVVTFEAWRLCSRYIQRLRCIPEKGSKQLGLRCPEVAWCSVQVFEWQLCSEPKRDSHRFMDTIDAAIAEVSHTHASFIEIWGTATMIAAFVKCV